MTAAPPSPRDTSAVGETHRLSRPLDRSWVGGVAAGLGEHLRVAPVFLRALFVVLAAYKLVGVGAYLVLWLALAPAAAASAAPGVSAATRGGLRTATVTVGPPRADLGQAIALGMMGAGLLWLVEGLGWGLGPRWLAAGAAATVGVSLVWWQADRAAPTEGDTREGRRGWGALLSAHWTTVAALGVGVAAVFVAVGTVAATVVDLGPLGTTLLAIGLSVIGLVVLALPWMLRARRALAAARERQLLSDARADMAAHLHDSVLQTLALIQRQAHDPRAVTRLARRQERALRGWLYGVPDQAETVRAALLDAAQEVEDDFPVSVECVSVGDAALTPPLSELVKAAREAMVNAAKHSGADVVDVYAEVSEASVEVFVRDRGRGFDPDSIAEDRRGVSGSILDRMHRHHGTARIRSTEGRGTEVSLEMKR